MPIKDIKQLRIINPIANLNDKLLVFILFMVLINDLSILVNKLLHHVKVCLIVRDFIRDNCYLLKDFQP